MKGAQVTKRSMFSMQVCVPDDFTDDQALEFAHGENPCGTAHGWSMRKQGDEALAGADERVKCLQRSGFVHIMFDA